MINFLVSLSENDKRLLITVLLVFILALLIYGWLVMFIKGRMNKYGKGIDPYMADALQYGAIKNTKEFRKYVREKETVSLVKKLALPFYILIVTTLFILIFGSFFGLNFQTFGESISSLGFDFVLREVDSDNYFIRIVQTIFPNMVKVPVLLQLHNIISYLIFIIYLVFGFIFIRGSLIYLSRLERSRVMSKTVFEKTLDDLKIEER